MIPRPLRSTLFPYTTLFRSLLISSPLCQKVGTALAEGRVFPAVNLLNMRIRSRRRQRSSRGNRRAGANGQNCRSEEHTSELQSRENLVCRLLLEKKKIKC